MPTAAKKNISESCKGCHRLRDLYERHRSGKKLQDADWTAVREHLTHHVSMVVNQGDAKYPPPLVAETIEEVAGRLFIKFYRATFDAPDNMEGFLWDIIPLDLISYLRTIRSVNSFLDSQTADDDGRTMMQSRAGVAKNEEPEIDAFETIRSHFPEPRFTQFRHVREMVLAYLLDTGRYPFPKFCSSVPEDRRELVFNVSVIEVNKALEAVSMGGCLVQG